MYKPNYNYPVRNPTEGALELQLLRIGNKLIDLQRIHREVDRIFNLREKGMSQKQTAERVGVERTLISRLENLGEVRKGKKIALIAFPVENKQKVITLAQNEGLDYILVMNEQERLHFVEDKSGVDLFNQIMDIISMLSSFDVVIFIGSDMRIPLIERIIDTEVVSICIGKSPIRTDKEVPISRLEHLIGEVRSA